MSDSIYEALINAFYSLWLLSNDPNDLDFIVDVPESSFRDRLRFHSHTGSYYLLS